MTYYEFITIVVSGLAFVVSAISLYLHFQDRPSLKIISEFVPSSEYGSAYIALSVVNSGKRPLVITMWGGSGDNGKWVGEFIGNERKGLRLAEKERYNIVLRKEDMVAITPDEEVVFSDLWVEDSLGKRYSVPRAKQYVVELLNE